MPECQEYIGKGMEVRDEEFKRVEDTDGRFDCLLFLNSIARGRAELTPAVWLFASGRLCATGFREWAAVCKFKPG